MFDVKDTDFFDLDDSAFDTIVEDDISFTGEIKIKKTFMIRGKVNGKISSTSDIVIDSNAVVNADIEAERVLIRGKVKGNVIGNKLIFITSSGAVDGDITTGKVVLEPGCVFSGKCTMVKNENEK
ncbi:polymer-forming cytoskeletal protein [Treponema sp. Marseille-Q3903]|uniref:bactofilin family protein n=1 Tax=Treponema sp. Marseille-Q3903 TaxID=2766703 RepID=UPI0016520C4F|nr:polymer-forming cytoskeletal protein [Treponema sp. Marseille-Q3903]MBC6713441.1 polymer-forming cytoskeletal protein [Treponema sp. Marseille-Q3903]